MAAPPGLYTSVIRERWRRPRFRGELPGATVTAEDVNPLCGDRVRLALRLEDGAVAQARFTGDSCAICSASADVLLEKIQGRRVPEAAAVTTEDLLAAFIFIGDDRAVRQAYIAGKRVDGSQLTVDRPTTRPLNRQL